MVLEEFHTDHIHPFPNYSYTNPSSIHTQIYVLSFLKSIKSNLYFTYILRHVAFQLKRGQPTRSHNLKENWLSLSQWLSIAIAPHQEGHFVLSSSLLGFCLDSARTLWVLYNCSTESRKCQFCYNPPSPLVLKIFPSVFHSDPWDYKSGLAWFLHILWLKYMVTSAVGSHSQVLTVASIVEFLGGWRRGRRTVYENSLAKTPKETIYSWPWAFYLSLSGV